MRGTDPGHELVQVRDKPEEEWDDGRLMSRSSCRRENTSSSARGLSPVKARGSWCGEVRLTCLSDEEPSDPPGDRSVGLCLLLQRCESRGRSGQEGERAEGSRISVRCWGPAVCGGVHPGKGGAGEMEVELIRSVGPSRTQVRTYSSDVGAQAFGECKRRQRHSYIHARGDSQVGKDGNEHEHRGRGDGEASAFRRSSLCRQRAELRVD